MAEPADDQVPGPSPEEDAPESQPAEDVALEEHEPEAGDLGAEESHGGEGTEPAETEEGFHDGEGEGLEEGDPEALQDEEGGDPEVLSTPYGANVTAEQDEDMPDPNRLQELLSARSASNSSHNSRPPSAVMNLRGSRPNSAAIAQEIEGFEDDFMERVEEEEEEEVDEYRQEEEGQEEDYGPTVEELIDRAQMEQQRLQEINEMLQKKARLALEFRNRGRPVVNRDTSRLDGVNVRYKSSLKQWVEFLEDRDRVENHYQTTVFDMKSALEERIKRADDISRAYKHFRLEVAKSAEHSKTGRPISERLLAHLEREDQEKEEEVQRVRLKNIHLSNQLKRIEQTLRQKEELAEGLHLIDFEQLKIENQSLNEKIEERNEELLKLRKKTTTTVQILTHIREKLQFVEKENSSLASHLDELDTSLSERRDKVGKVKATRDTLRQKTRRIKENSVFITNPTLLDDIENLKERKEQLLLTLEDTRKEHMLLSDVISKSNTKIMNMTEDLAAVGVPNAANIMRNLQSSKSRGSTMSRAQSESIRR